MLSQLHPKFDPLKSDIWALFLGEVVRAYREHAATPEAVTWAFVSMEEYYHSRK